MPQSRTRPRIERREGKRGHSYFIDGERADGVTTLLGGGLPKPALPYWAAKSVAEYVVDELDSVRELTAAHSRAGAVAKLKQVPWDKRDAAANRGTEVHALAEALGRGDEVDVPDELTGYVQSCVDFLDEWRVEPIVSEVVVASRQWRYCGTLDFVGRLPDGRVVIGDYKTSGSGIYSSTALQLAAYAHAEVYLDSDGEEQPVSSLGISEGVGVWLRPDGYSVFRLNINDEAFNAFLHVAYVARVAKQKLDGWISDELPIPSWDSSKGAA